MGKIGQRVVLAIVLIALPSQTIAGTCFEPRAPSSLFLSKPRIPFCVSSRTCSQFDIDNYKREVSRYFGQLQEYLDDVAKFRKAAVEYVDCMSQLD